MNILLAGGHIGRGVAKLLDIIKCNVKDFSSVKVKVILKIKTKNIFSGPSFRQNQEGGTHQEGDKNQGEKKIDEEQKINNETKINTKTKSNKGWV